MEGNAVKNNKGLSLVELIVAITIAAIVSAAVLGFIVTSTHQYRIANAEVNLQYEAQIAINQMQDLLIDATNGITYLVDDVKVSSDAEAVSGGANALKKEICIFNRESTTQADGKEVVQYTETRIIWKAAYKNIYYSKYKCEADVTGKYTNIPIEENCLLAEYVKSFSADLTKISSKRLAGVEFIFETGGRSFTAQKDITLRNSVQLNGEKEDVFQEDNASVIPTVTGVAITPQKVDVERGSSVTFTANVLGTNFPRQDVKWSIDSAVTDVATTINTNTGVLTIGENETSSSIQVRALSVQSELNAQGDVTKHVSSTAAATNCYLTKLNLSDLSVSGDLHAAGVLQIEGVNIKNIDAASKINFSYEDLYGSKVEGITARLEKDNTASSVKYNIVFETIESNVNTPILIKANIGTLVSNEKTIKFRQKTVKSVSLQGKLEDGTWETYTGSIRPSKRGESIELRLEIEYEGPKPTTEYITAADSSWNKIDWTIAGENDSGKWPDQLSQTMALELKSSNVLKISKELSMLNANLEYGVGIKASYRDKSTGKMTIKLPKVKITIPKAHESTQNRIAILYDTPGNLKLKVEGYLPELGDIVATSTEKDITVTTISGDAFQILAASGGKNGRNIEVTFSLKEDTGKGQEQIEKTLYLIAGARNVAYGFLWNVSGYHDIFVPARTAAGLQNSNVFYDIYGNKITYKKQTRIVIDGKTYDAYGQNSNLIWRQW